MPEDNRERKLFEEESLTGLINTLRTAASAEQFIEALRKISMMTDFSTHPAAMNPMSPPGPEFIKAEDQNSDFARDVLAEQLGRRFLAEIVRRGRQLGVDMQELQNGVNEVRFNLFGLRGLLYLMALHLLQSLTQRSKAEK